MARLRYAQAMPLQNILSKVDLDKLAPTASRKAFFRNPADETDSIARRASPSGDGGKLRSAARLRPRAQHPHHSASDYQNQRDELGGAHDPAKHRSTVGIGAQEFQKVSSDAV